MSKFKKTRAPREGYDFSEKQIWRETVWGWFRKLLQWDTATRQAVLMPSSNRAEIDVAIAHGFREENLHIVDGNGANIAVQTHRFPRIHPCGIELERAFQERLAPRSISAASIDLTTNASSRLAETIANILKSGALAERSVIAVNILRGRERKSEPFVGGLRSRTLPSDVGLVVSEYRSRHVGRFDLTFADAMRLLVIESRTPEDVCFALKQSGSYAGPQSSMLWSVWVAESAESACGIRAASRSQWRAADARYRFYREGMERRIRALDAIERVYIDEFLRGVVDEDLVAR